MHMQCMPFAMHTTAGAVRVWCHTRAWESLTGGLDGDAPVLLILPGVCQPRIASLQDHRQRSKIIHWLKQSGSSNTYLGIDGHNAVAVHEEPHMSQ